MSCMRSSQLRFPSVGLQRQAGRGARPFQSRRVLALSARSLPDQDAALLLPYPFAPFFFLRTLVSLHM